MIGKPWSQPLRDFATGLALFVVLALPGFGLCSGGAAGFLGESALAHYEVREVEGILEAVLQVSASPQFAGAMNFASLAFAFASLFTLNVWLLRHVRHMHVTSQRKD